MPSYVYWLRSRLPIQLVFGIGLVIGMVMQVVAADDARQPSDDLQKSEALAFVEANDEALPDDVVKVTISQFKYNPAEITVEPGTTVLWTNEDPMGHNGSFVAEDIADVSEDLAGPIIGQGEAFAVRFNKSGRYDYYCTPHPFMKGLVIVK